jgi:large subunit ribosomal protein L7Ae
LLVKYQPETKEAKIARQDELAKATAAGEAPPSVVPPLVLKYGLKHVTHLIEQKKAKMICIAHDVNPIELVVWLPALCRKMDIPFCIVKGKARLGTLTNKKNAAVIAITKVNKEDENKLKTLQENFKNQFNDNPEKHWGGGIMGLKTQAKVRARVRDSYYQPSFNY